MLTRLFEYCIATQNRLIKRRATGPPLWVRTRLMANQRLSTIYDYATLRLHRDGTRVQQSDENYHVPKRKQFAIKDASGNWIAKDAGGLGTANKTRYVRREEDDGQEYVSLGGGEEEREVEKTDEWVLLERERTQRGKDHRTEKRRRFEENLDFLDVSHNASSTSTPTREPSLPVPSSVCRLLLDL